MFCVQNMGMNSKQVSGGGDGDGLDWIKINLMQDEAIELPNKISNQAQQPPDRQQQQQQEQQEQQKQMNTLKCPRCDSSNTKFCYYNNYNKLQPRHFCKSCRRHWTKGGTLRNVPVGGGQKNKRLKTSTPTTTTTTPTMIRSRTSSTTAAAAITAINNINASSSRTSTTNENISIVVPQQHQPLGLFGDLIHHQSLLQPNSVRPDDYANGSSEENKSSFLGSMPSLDSLLNLPITSTAINPSSSPMSCFSHGDLESTNCALNYTGEVGTSEYPSLPSVSWPLPAATNLVDSSNCLSWEDLNSLIS
ncbi:hypothetical protein Sjap_025588 [Stephania japonica]|uniref:Dof zinc finger protein n=1 Tax=Stephania japonica TaxID=461633 RepID=A0AAP0E5G8_9MAGN